MSMLRSIKRSSSVVIVIESMSRTSAVALVACLLSSSSHCAATSSLVASLTTEARCLKARSVCTSAEPRAQCMDWLWWQWSQQWRISPCRQRSERVIECADAHACGHDRGRRLQDHTSEHAQEERACAPRLESERVESSQVESKPGDRSARGASSLYRRSRRRSCVHSRRHDGCCSSIVDCLVDSLSHASERADHTNVH